MTFREAYHQEMADALVSHLSETIPSKEPGHCLRIEHLPLPVMRLACSLLRSSRSLVEQRAEFYVLSDERREQTDIVASALIERRNARDLGVLVAFIPQGLTAPAEDSFGAHTFESYDLKSVLRLRIEELVEQFPTDISDLVGKVLRHDSLRDVSIDRKFRYVVALVQEGADKETVGAYLHHLGLVPDLEFQIDRLERNRRCVDELANPERPILESLRQLNEKYGLGAGDVTDRLTTYLLNRDVTDRDAWLEPILSDESLRKTLTFNRWEFADIARKNDIKVELEPLLHPKTKTPAKGFQLDEAGNLFATTDARSPVTIKWKTLPAKPEAIGSFLIRVVRDSDENESEDLFSRRVEGSKRTVKLSLKDIALDPGEFCTAKIVITALDNSTLTIKGFDDQDVRDETEPFYIQGGESVESTSEKRPSRVRNRADAVFLSALDTKKQIEIDSEGWEVKSPNVYRIKLKTRQISHIVLNGLLKSLELKVLAEPDTLGAFKLVLTNSMSVSLDDIKPVELSLSSPEIDDFYRARRDLFHRILETDGAVVETLDLREYRDEIDAYIEAYGKALSAVRGSIDAATSDGTVNNLLTEYRDLERIDTVELNLNQGETNQRAVMVGPTHPLKLGWLLQYQTLVFGWASALAGKTEEEVTRMIGRLSLLRITSLNCVPSLVFGQDDAFVNTDNLDFYWSILPHGGTSDVRRLVGQLQRMFGVKEAEGEITSVNPEQLADKLKRYLRHHPYVSTLKINVINPGDGLVLLNAVRLLQRDFPYLCYDISFFGDERYESLGRAFDDLMEDRASNKIQRKDEDEDLLRPSANPLFPKLVFAKHRISEFLTEDRDQSYEAHVTIIIDYFRTKVLTRKAEAKVGSNCLHNLLSEYRTDFALDGAMATWSRKIVPNQNKEITPELRESQLLFDAVDNLLRVNACLMDWGNNTDKVPTIQLELADDTEDYKPKRLITESHNESDWVFTVDRNFGVEYFDSPQDPHSKSYLIDYVPEFLDNIGHRLIVSTYWITEIETIIGRGLTSMGIESTSFQASEILNILKSISGKLALKLINNPNTVREIIGLSLTHMLLRESGKLKSGILMPVDSHISLFSETKADFQDSDLTLKRSDLLLARFEDSTLVLNLIEVKFRSGDGVAEEHDLKQAIALKNTDTEKVIRKHFDPASNTNRLDQEMKNKELASLLQFYFDRACRHELFESTDEIRSRVQSALIGVLDGDFDMRFEKSGYIFNLTGISKPVDHYDGNEIHVVGRDRIWELLGLETDEQTETPDNTLPSEPAENHSGAVTVEPLIAESEQEPPTGSISQEPETPISGATNSNQEEIERSKPQDFPEAVKPQIVPDPPAPEFRLLLGKNCDTNADVWWSPFKTTPKKLANQHVLIVGKSGSGKTQTTMAFLLELQRLGVPSLIFDFQGEYMDSDFSRTTGCRTVDVADGIPMNPLELPIDPATGNPQNFSRVVYQVAQILAKICGLGDIQHAILRDTINEAFLANGFHPMDKSTWGNTPPTFSDVWAKLDARAQHEGAQVKNLRFRVQPILDTGIFQLSGHDITFEEMLTTTTVLRLSNLITPELMVASARFILQKVYSFMLSRGLSQDLKVFCVVDEAHKLSYDETLTDLMKEARKYGIGILLASQETTDFDKSVFLNTGTLVALQLESEDAKVMAENLGLINPADRNIARELLMKHPPGRALVRNNHYDNPYALAQITFFYERILSD
jgi:hypothetical protein